MALIVLALTAGFFTAEKTWAVVVVLLLPVMFVGSDRHGRPWDWLVGSLIFPPLLIYFLMNMGPVIVAYAVVVSIGQFIRRRTGLGIEARR